MTFLEIHKGTHYLLKNRTAEKPRKNLNQSKVNIRISALKPQVFPTDPTLYYFQINNAEHVQTSKPSAKAII